MGIFNAFKKNKNKNEAEVEEIREEKNSVKQEAAENNTENTENVESYILTQERCNELLQRIFKDGDHGNTMMEEVSLSENIFILGYIENVIMPDLKKKGNEKDYTWFYSTMAIYRKIFHDKIMKTDRLWKVMLKTTGLPFMDRGCEHILICDSYKDKFIENLKNIYYEVDVVEISNEQFKGELNELYRRGYKGICFSDGVQRPYYMSRESLVSFDEVPASSYLINPETQYSMAAFFQEMRRNVNYEGAEKIRQNLENAMINSIINTRFVIPVKKSNVNQAELPVYISSEDKEKGIVIPGIYVFTDKIELSAVEEKNLDLNDGWDIYTYDFPQLMNLLDEAHVSEICINCGSINFKVNEKSLEVLKKQYESMDKERAEAQEKWETEELPKMLKDKNVPVIKDSRGTPLFARKENSVLMSKFIFDILVKREMKDEIMQFFFDDESIENISLYDFDFRRVTLKLKDEGNKKGLFVMPMRYDDENDSEPVDDTSLHYTMDAADIYNESIKDAEAYAGSRTMHFYTIENKDTKKIYIPLFSNEKEAEKIYARDKFRYCMVSYRDIMKNVKKYDGAVINPASMSFILEKELLDNVSDIVNE